MAMMYTFRLFGPRKGKTMSINGHPFVRGEYAVTVSADAANSLVKVLSYYGAFVKGSTEYDEAVAKEEAENGASEVHEKAKPGPTAGVRGGVQSDGGESSSEETDGREGHVDSEAGSTGSDSSGDGHGHTGVPKFEEAEDIPEPTEPETVANSKVAEAIKKLDPENADHWVSRGAYTGSPKLSAVEEAYGEAGLTREDLNNALPNWNRDKARALK